MVGHSKAGKGPTGKGPRREFQALTSAGRRHDTGWAEKNLQGGTPAGAHSVQLRSGFERLALTRPSEERERERKWRLDQDLRSLKLVTHYMEGTMRIRREGA